MTLTDRIDEVATMRKERLALQKTVDKLKADEDGLAAAIAAEMRAEGVTFLSGDAGKMTLKQVEAAEVRDYHALYEYIKQTGSFDLLQKRISLSGVRERWQIGNEVPGVARILEESFTLGNV